MNVNDSGNKTERIEQMSEKKMYRFRISVPEESEQIIEWCKNQSNTSYAFMCVIRDWIAKYGTGNVFAQHIDLSPKRGRPSNIVRESLSQQVDTMSESSRQVSYSDHTERNNDLKSAQQFYEKNEPKLSDDGFDDEGFFDFEQSSPGTSGSSSQSILDMMNGG